MRNLKAYFCKRLLALIIGQFRDALAQAVTWVFNSSHIPCHLCFWFRTVENWARKGELPWIWMSTKRLVDPSHSKPPQNQLYRSVELLLKEKTRKCRCRRAAWGTFRTPQNGQEGNRHGKAKQPCSPTPATLSSVSIWIYLDHGFHVACLVPWASHFYRAIQVNYKLEKRFDRRRPLLKATSGTFQTCQNGQ